MHNQRAEARGFFFLFVVCFMSGVHHLSANFGNPSSLGLLGKKVGKVVKNRKKKKDSFTTSDAETLFINWNIKQENKITRLC